jgi:predicted kinase
MICGLPGVGKTTTAKLLAPHIEGVVISSDEIRKKLFKAPTYRTHEKYLVYEAMILVAQYLHNADVNCILDATFSKERTRSQIRNKLGVTLKEFHVIECVCPENVVMNRLKTRKNDFSNADFSVYKMIKRIYEPVKQEHTKLDTESLSEKEIENLALNVLQAN